MSKKIEEASKKGEEVAREYNLKTNIPFPFEKIVEKNTDLDIFLDYLDSEGGEKNISGLILFKKQEERFEILIEKSEPKNRQYFTAAHELGHYFLHKDRIKKEGIVIDRDPMWYRLDEGLTNIEETEANFFAGSLLMPEKRVRKIWGKTKSIEKCADFFDVSMSAMSVRLEILKLVYG